MGYPGGGGTGQIRRYIGVLIVLFGEVDADIDY